MARYSVYLGACSAADPAAVTRVLDDALTCIPLKKPLSGRIVIKPNLVMAHPRVATGAFTSPAVVEGVIRMVLTRAGAVESLSIVEKSGLGVTTASMFRWAGYRRLARNYPVNLVAMEESPQTRVVLERSRLHPCITVARAMAERDFLIFVPKLKTNVLSQGYSGALKLNIGTVDSRERMAHHHRDLPVKIVDLLEAADPDLIVTDGIRFAFGGNQMTQTGVDFGVVAVSANAVAHDMVCARLLNLDPMKIAHIREAAGRGYGPSHPDDVEILGDFPLKRGRSLVSTLDLALGPVESFDSPFHIVTGKPDCPGGCRGIFHDWLLMIRDRKPGLIRRFPRVTVLIGKVDEPVHCKTAVLLGGCAAASPNLHCRRVVRIGGCPPTHKRIVWDMMVRFGLLAPLVRPSLIIDGFVLYPLKKLKGMWVNRHRLPRRTRIRSRETAGRRGEAIAAPKTEI